MARTMTDGVDDELREFFDSLVKYCDYRTLSEVMRDAKPHGTRMLSL